MEKFEVNKEACIGCGACMAICPAVFEINDEGLATTIKDENLTDEEIENATDAMEGCPTGSISKKENLTDEEKEKI